MRARMALWALVLGCAGTTDDEVVGEPTGCDPTDPALCVLPFPSSTFLAEADTVTGWQVHYGDEMLPKNRDGVQVKPTYWNERDGFSISSPMLTMIPGVSLEGTASHADIGASVADDSPTVILDADTGARVPHWVELDATAPSPEMSLFMIRPAVALEYDHHYVVALRGLVSTEGGPIEPSEGFRALRDGDGGDADVEAIRSRYERDVFPVLTQAGVDRDGLIQAWDFRTASRDNTLGRLEWMRDDMLARVGDSGPPYVIEKVEDLTDQCGTEGGPDIGRSIEGHMIVPRYTVEELPPTLLSRDQDGMPFYVTDREADFIIRVPCSVLLDPAPSRIVQYGHGLLGDHLEARAGWLSRQANTYGWIVFAVSWTGMMDYDVPAITLMSALDPSDFAIVPERSHQGMIEAAAAMRMMLGDMADDPLLVVDGVHLVDKTRRSYYGNSQGGILGAAYMGLSTDLDHGVLGVPGGPYSVLLPRSTDFDPFFKVFKEKFLDHREITLMITGMMQQLWDPTEGSGWMREMGDKRLLLQVAIGDAQVTPLGAAIMARSYGATTVAPQTRPIWGVDEASGDLTGSAIVEFEYTDVPEAPFVSLPPEEGHDTHECPRREPAAQEQMDAFFEEGVVRNYCGGGNGVCQNQRAGLCD